MEKIVTVKSVEIMEKNGRSWKKVTYKDGRSDNVFPKAVGYGLLQPKTSVGQDYKLVLEKDGNFWNVVQVLLPFPEPPKLVSPTGALKDTKSFSLAYAKDLCVAGMIPLDQLIFFAELFDRYLSGEYQQEFNSDEFHMYLAHALSSKPSEKSESKGKGVKDSKPKQEEMAF